MTDLQQYLDGNRKAHATRNAAAFRRIAAHLNESGREDASGNTARTFEACAERSERIARERV